MKKILDELEFELNNDNTSVNILETNEFYFNSDYNKEELWLFIENITKLYNKMK